MSQGFEIKSHFAHQARLDFVKEAELRMFRWHYWTAGSLRRLRPIVHDVDLVFHSMEPGFPAGLKILCGQLGKVKIESWGPKIARVTYGVVPFDFYFTTKETEQTTLLIRTGPKENNIRLCMKAQKRGWKMHSGGDGLFDEKNNRIAWRSEEEIYAALELPYQDPWDRT